MKCKVQNHRVSAIWMVAMSMYISLSSTEDVGTCTTDM
jgi:hypothetical protein